MKTMFLLYVEFEVLTAVVIKISIFCSPLALLDTCFMPIFCLICSSTMKMEAEMFLLKFSSILKEYKVLCPRR
jgi:hypothetical protein